MIMKQIGKKKLLKKKHAMSPCWQFSFADLEVFQDVRQCVSVCVRRLSVVSRLHDISSLPSDWAAPRSPQPRPKCLRGNGDGSFLPRIEMKNKEQAAAKLVSGLPGLCQRWLRSINPTLTDRVSLFWLPLPYSRSSTTSLPAKAWASSCWQPSSWCCVSLQSLIKDAAMSVALHPWPLASRSAWDTWRR